ncbi:hypothetical protein PMI34_02650 [Pseudomonas sp. GM74]|uniref:hypothetical protein n=1 Tax=Pseudomonas sp. GM74 TaxID=1144336 RepID=UPI000270AB4E|nr:hypothetical protein [Pseudomonas sp. GM74]EJM91084.1 hypothetical protein PMI34_02650 [Pseudomonas sp. GM74]
MELLVRPVAQMATRFGDLFVGCDTVVLEDFSKLLVIPLRDGCDLMDVIGRRLRAQAAE